jgi:hypothetical protein
MILSDGLLTRWNCLKPKYPLGKICVRCQPNICFMKHWTQLTMTKAAEGAWQITPEKVQAVVRRLIQIGDPRRSFCSGRTFGVMRLGIATWMYWLRPAILRNQVAFQAEQAAEKAFQVVLVHAAVEFPGTRDLQSVQTLSIYDQENGISMLVSPF